MSNTILPTITTNLPAAADLTSKDDQHTSFLYWQIPISVGNPPSVSSQPVRLSCSNNTYLVGEVTAASPLTPKGSVIVGELIVISRFDEGMGVAIYEKQHIITSPATSSTTAASPISQPISSTVSQTSSSVISSTISSASPSGTLSSSRNGVSNGAAAGIAIGCLIAGILLAGLLACFLAKRKKPSRFRDSEVSTIDLMHNGKDENSNKIPLQTAAALPFATNHELSQPLEDQAISGETSKISNLVKNHVQSYYHTKIVTPGAIDYDDLQALGDDLPISIGTLSTLLGNATSRETALRLCIAWVVTARMKMRSSPSISFLPIEISECLASISPIDGQSQAQLAKFTRWRVSTASLLQSTYVDKAWSGNDSRIQNVQEAVRVLGKILQPYADSRMNEGARIRNLEEIVKRAAQFSFTLFSQPTEWDFDWQKEQSLKSGSICIFPTLVQTLDENGMAVRPPRSFNEAVIRQLDE